MRYQASAIKTFSISYKFGLNKLEDSMTLLVDNYRDFLFVQSLKKFLRRFLLKSFYYVKQITPA